MEGKLDELKGTCVHELRGPCFWLNVVAVVARRGRREAKSGATWNSEAAMSDSISRYANADVTLLVVFDSRVSQYRADYHLVVSCQRRRCFLRRINRRY